MRFTKSLSLGAIALGLAVGCAPSNPGVVAQGVLANDGMCLITATNPYLVEGTLDLATDGLASARLGVTYSVAVRVGNQLINTGNRIYPLRADTNTFIVDHMEVTLLDQTEATLAIPGAPNPYLVPASGAIGSTTSSDPTIGFATATIIPDGYGRALASLPQFTGVSGTLLVRIRVIGTTAGSSVVTTGPVLFPIRTCFGCLFTLLGCTMGVPDTGTLSCLPGQDSMSYIETAPGACP